MLLKYVLQDIGKADESCIFPSIWINFSHHQNDCIMKQLMLFLLIAPNFLAVDANLAGISKALGDGDATALGSYFDQSVEVAILEKEDFYDKAQAIEQVRAFFRTHPPKSFNQIHKGSSQSSDSQYCIGDLITSDTKYRVYIYMKNIGGKTLIQELRFNKE